MSPEFSSKCASWSWTALAFALLVAGTGCQPDYPSCDNDQHCKAKSEYCVNGLCQQCRSNDNCGTCTTCNAGRCQPVAGCCQSDGDCTVAQKCRAGSCGPQCVDDNECGDGARCSTGRCVPTAECATSGDCAGGFTCEAGRCVPSPQETSGCELQRVFFDFDSAEIGADSRRTLDGNAECLRQQGNPAITVEGHCDDRGTEEYNLALGERRARAAKRYLERLGVSSMRVVSYGENRPLSSGYSEGELSRNRRSEFVLR